MIGKEQLGPTLFSGCTLNSDSVFQLLFFRDNARTSFGMRHQFDSYTVRSTLHFSWPEWNKYISSLFIFPTFISHSAWSHQIIWWSVLVNHRISVVWKREMNEGSREKKEQCWETQFSRFWTSELREKHSTDLLCLWRWGKKLLMLQVELDNSDKLEKLAI